MTKFLSAILLCMISCGASYAQSSSVNPLVPLIPTSADTIYFRLPPFACNGQLLFGDNPYRVAMVQNNITVTVTEKTIGEVTLSGYVRDMFEGEIGKLPAGDYTFTLINKACLKKTTRIKPTQNLLITRSGLVMRGL